MVPPGWIRASLGELGDCYGGSTPSSVDSSLWGGNIRWLVPSEISGLQDCQTHIYETESKLTEKGYRSSSTKLLPAGTVAVSSRATVGDSIIFGNDICTNQGFINVVCNDRVNNLFLLYWLRGNKRKLLRLSAGTTFNEIGRSTFKKIRILIPKCTNEQQCIAGAIQSIDTAISAARESIAKAERLQKALMQQLLCGRMRPDGSMRKKGEFREEDRIGTFPRLWVAAKLRDVVRFKNGKSNVTANLRQESDSEYRFPVYGGNGMTGWSNRYLLEEPAIVVGRVGEYCGAVHRAEAYSWITDNALYVSETLIPANLDFLFYVFLGLRLNRLKATTGQPKVTQSEILNLRVALPQDTGEQEAIAGVIKQFESLITAKKSKIAALQRLKKALMQNLLTGRTRLPVEGAEEDSHTEARRARRVKA